MAQEIATSILINASPSAIWNILLDFEKYPQWNPHISNISGTPIVGQTIIATMTPPNGRAITFRPKVLAFEPNKLFVWKGKLLIKGLFDGEHRFEIIPQSNGTTLFVQSEKFSGILVPFFKKMIEIDTKNNFNAMNEKLKELAETS
jgi:hypothetical protein